LNSSLLFCFLLFFIALAHFKIVYQGLEWSSRLNENDKITQYERRFKKSQCDVDRQAFINTSSRSPKLNENDKITQYERRCKKSQCDVDRQAFINMFHKNQTRICDSMYFTKGLLHSHLLTSFKRANLCNLPKFKLSKLYALSGILSNQRKSGHNMNTCQFSPKNHVICPAQNKSKVFVF